MTTTTISEASSLLDRALELADDDEARALVYALIGRCRLGQQRREDGISALKKSLQLDGDGRFAAECRRILRELGE